MILSISIIFILTRIKDLSMDGRDSGMERYRTKLIWTYTAADWMFILSTQENSIWNTQRYYPG